ncbi:MAG TPA: enoyl-CoA hydratase [Acidimicrobiaceae bacterium]|nr:enoyl-CoA hydratase [Acidimicrobiaceae bacterium]|tara:strand:- start:1611 stop:2426 length:816 start_codon:yes stop_codon:yes gene_type:complete
MEDEYENLVVDFPEPEIARITLDRPERLNAMTYGLVTDLHQALDQIDGDHSVRVLILTGAGRGFCAGLDLTGFGRIPGTEDFGEQQQGMAVQQHIAELVHRMRDVRQPIIAGVNGAAAGGGFALACASDVRYCGTSAKFGTAFVRLGISGCDIGVSWMLPRLIGASRAGELMLTGRVIDAEEANRIGLVTNVVPDDELQDKCLSVAREISRNSPFGVWMTKEVMWSNLEIPSLRAGIDLENRTQILAAGTEDSKTAMSSFLGKGEPIWENR